MFAMACASRAAAVSPPSPPASSGKKGAASGLKSSLKRNFLYVPYGSSAPEDGRPSLSCDGKVPGTTLELTHWTDNVTPDELYADTSTVGMGGVQAAGWLKAPGFNA